MTDLDIDPLDLVLPERYGLGAFPHEAWTALRAEDPVHWTEPEGYRPFWAITKHADIKAISSSPTSSPRCPASPSNRSPTSRTCSRCSPTPQTRAACRCACW